METAKATILIVDDELSIRESFSLILEGQYNLLLAASGEAALKKITDQKVDLVFLDIRMPGMNGLETLERIRHLDKHTPVIMVTAVNDVGKAAEATKKGAQEYLIKPFNVPQILGLVEETLRRRALQKEAKQVRAQAEEKPQQIEIIGQTERINILKENLEKIAPESSPVLITGPTGTEKEKVAALIHRKSPRAAGPFIAYHLVKDMTLYQAREILLGFKGGQSAYTIEKEMGLLEAANGGTLFLNNLEFLPHPFQKELARFIAERKIKEAENELEFTLDIRIIAAVSAHPKSLLQEKLLDKALYQELSQIVLEIPSLKSRSTDIPLLVTEWLDKINQKYGLTIKGFTKDALDCLSAYSWPGNVDQLVSVLESMALTTQSDFISVEELPLDILLSSPVALSSRESEYINQEAILNHFSKDYIEKIMARNDNDPAATAKVLGLTPNAFAIKAESLEIEL